MAMTCTTAAASARHARRAAGALMACVLLTGAGCGSTSDYKNRPRLPAPIVLGTSIASTRISVSPSRFGAGPVLLVITNQSPAARSLTLQTDEINGSKSGLTQTTSAISPQGTAQLSAVLREGRYRVRVDDSAVRAAELVVGPARPSAQDQVLQP